MISSRALLFVRSGIHPGEIAIIFRAQGSGQNWSPRNPAQAPYVKAGRIFFASGWRPRFLTPPGQVRDAAGVRIRAAITSHLLGSDVT